MTVEKKKKELEEIKKRASLDNPFHVELFPELEITPQKIQQVAVAKIEEMKTELEKVVEHINNFYMPPAVSFPDEQEIQVQVPKSTNMTLTQQLVHRGYMGYVDFLAILIPRRNCAFTLYVDGKIEGAFMTTHQIGTIEQPMQYKPPLEVNSNIRVIGYNTDTVEDHCFRVIMRGRQYPDPYKDASFWEKIY